MACPAGAQEGRHLRFPPSCESPLSLGGRGGDGRTETIKERQRIFSTVGEHSVLPFLYLFAVSDTILLHIWFTLRRALLCRACGNLTVCVAERYLILRTGYEKHGRKNPLPFPFSKRSPVSGLRQIRKQGKGRSSKRKENRRLSFLFAPAAGAANPRAPQSAAPR